MALTASETFGGVVPGFVTDLNGNLATAVAGSDQDVVHGFLTDADGRLVTTTDATGATWQGGFLRSPAGALVTAPSGTRKDIVPGFVTNDTGALVTDTTATEWRGGFRVGSGGGLAVASAGEWGGTYTESFTTDDGGWVVAGAGANAVDRYTFISDTAPACLRFRFFGNSDTAVAAKVLPGDPGSYALTMKAYWPPLTSVNVDFEIQGLDAGDVEIDAVSLLNQNFASGTWRSISVSGALVGASITQVAIVVRIPNVGVEADGMFIDTVQLEKTA